MPPILKQIQIANEECETMPEWIALWWRVFAGLGFCIPILFVAGFITACLMFKNPVQGGFECVNGMF